jgi:hypothetical protein
MRIQSAAISDSSELPGSEGQRLETADPATDSDAMDVNVPDRTQVEIELLSPVSSQLAMRGDLIDFEVVRPVKVNGATVIEKGALATARVTEVKKAGHWGRGGKIAWELQRVVAADGSYILLDSARKVTGHGTERLVIGNAVATGIAFMSLGIPNPLLPVTVLRHGFTRGDPATVSAGERFWVFVRGDHLVRVESRRLRIKGM